ncbi:diguanylate cyclase domain-containing protein, partial [Elusimicrobiota bacterium]
AVCRALRRDHRTRHIPIMILTGQSGREEESYGLNIGADEYMSKPFDVRTLKARAAALLRRSQASVGLNPLTLLPGNRAIRNETERRLRQGTRFSFTYVDIRHFKSLNDAWGFSWGDRVILAAAELLCRTSAGLDADGGFVGHIGGDDFVLVTNDRVDESTLRRRFDELMRSLEAEAGCQACDPRIGLSLGQVCCDPGCFPDYEELSQDASRAKEEAKEANIQ